MAELEQAAMRLSGVRPHLVGGTVFVALPAALHREIAGGCQCGFCKEHPDKTPMWDTLAIDAAAERHTWVVHYPELQGWWRRKN
jgi:hypothetical protein